MTQHQPDRLLINKNGDITTGLFEDTVARINGRDYDYRTPLGTFITSSSSTSAWSVMNC